MICNKGAAFPEVDAGTECAAFARKEAKIKQDGTLNNLSIFKYQTLTHLHYFHKEQMQSELTISEREGQKVLKGKKEYSS